LIQSGLGYLFAAQKSDGSFGGDKNTPSSIEETAVALQALCAGSSIHLPATLRAAMHAGPLASGIQWLITATRHGTHFPPAPVGLYFARLWYHEQLYPVIWMLGAMQAARRVLEREKH
jgi:squalene-hopene/tetraprenyl-beta-curcumene cyclase